MQEEQKEVKTPEPAKKKNYIKKFLKGILYVVAIFIVLNLLLYGLLSIPSVQQKVLRFAVGKLEEIVKTEVRVDEIRLSLFNNVHLKGIYIEDQKKDTLVYATNLDVSLSPLELLRNKLLIKGIELDDFTANISQETPDSDFNFQFLIDAFAGDTTSADTTSSSLIIDIQNIDLKRGKLRYDILSDTVTPGQFNASHIHIYDLNANLKLPSVDILNFEGSITSLSFIEASGLEVKNLKADLTSNKTTFFIKNAELSLPQSTLRIPSAQYNLLTSAFNLNSDQSILSPSDLLPFMKDLHHLKEDITLQTSLSGKLPAISIDSLILGYGEKAGLRASAAISDYSHYDQANLELNIGNLQITPDAINDFAKVGDSTFIMPDILKSLGTIRLQGALNGTLNKFNVNADAWAKQGALKLAAIGSADTTFENFSAKAKLQTQNFNLGSLLEIPELGRLSGNVDLVASQTQKESLKADVKGNILELQYNKEEYRNIPFTAYYNSAKMGGWLNADLPQGKLEAKVDMTQDNNPKIDVDVDIQKLKINTFYPIEGWENPELTMHMKGNFRGIDLRNIQADMIIDSLEFSHDSLSFKTKAIALQAGISDSARNYINLNSSLLNAKIVGDYDFMTITDEFSNMMNQYLPGLFKKTLRLKNNKNNFDIDISIQNTEELGRILDLPVNVIDPLAINGTVNTIDSKFDMSARIPKLRYSDMEINNTVLNLASSDSVISLTGGSKLLLESGNIGFDINTVASSDTVNTSLAIKRDSTDLNVDAVFKALAHFEFNSKGELVSSLQFSPSTIDIGKLDLSFMPAHIVNEGTRTSISNFGFMAGKGQSLNKYFGVDGVLSDQKQDTLNVSFSNSNLGYILKAFDIDNISTIANGNIQIAAVLGTPELYTDDIEFSDIIIFNDTLGTLSMKSQWSDEVGAIEFDAMLDKEDDSRPSIMYGQVYPRQDSLNLKINLERLSLAWVQPFMSDMLNKTSGSVSAGLTATGKISAPAVRGWLGVNDAYIGIDYTNVTYHISDTIEITPEKIGFDNLIVEDPSKNKARINALLTHKDFKNMQYTLDANLSNFMVLNTAARIDSLFYGKVFASGTVNIKGSDEAINMNMNLRNGKNSSLNIQIPQTSDANVYQSIVYINTPVDESKKKEDTSEPESTLPLKLNVNLTVTPDLALGIIIDPNTGDNMQAKGSGLIKFSYDMESEAMNAFGDYTLSDGSVKLKLQNLYNIELKIRDGSKLKFNGDPMNTNFDITAFKRVRADLRTLDSSFGNDQYNSPMVYAECVLGISGNINKMDLTYNVNIPDASDDVQQRFRTIMSASENQRTQQFAYLLVFNSFYGGGGGDIAGGVLTSVAGSALSGALNAVLGKAIGTEWQIGTNFESNDGTFNNMDMTVSLSRKFLDNKLEFNTNLGYRTDQTNNDQFIGDFDLAYALTRSIKLKVFNKTNDRYYRQAEMTQGVGIVYTREAKTLKNLFRFFRKKRNRTDAEQTGQYRSSNR